MAGSWAAKRPGIPKASEAAPVNLGLVHDPVHDPAPAPANDNHERWDDPANDNDRPRLGPMTDDEFLVRCGDISPVERLKDPKWRLHNLYSVMDETGLTVRFMPNEAQEQFLEDIWYRNVVPKARQRGFTTLIQILELDSALFTSNFRAATIAQDMPTVLKIFADKIKFAYDHLAPVVQRLRPITKNTETTISFSNNSSIYVAVSTRSGTLQFLHVSELGQITKKYPDKAAEIQTGSLPSVDKTGIIVIESTVESAAGLFPDMCRRAKKHQELGHKLGQMQYRLHFASWWDAPKYEDDPEGVILTKVDHDYFNRMEIEIGRQISPRKRAWYVQQRDEAFQGDWEKMKSQYPTILEEAFEVSQEGLWLGRQLSLVRTQRRICPLPHDPSKPVHFFWDIGKSDNNAVWCGQTDGPWMNWLRYYESSGMPYGHLINLIRIENPAWVWGQTWLPHDGKQRQYGTETLKDSKDLFEELGVPRVDIVPRTADLVEGGIEDLRAAMSLYRFDDVGTADGVLHLDGYAKTWNQAMGLWSSVVAKNGHQHGADALRQHAQIRHVFRPGGGTIRRTAKSKRSAMAA